MNWEYMSGLFFALCLVSFALTKAITAFLRRRQLLDLPNDRSSHSVPTPRGGGLAVVASILIGLAVCGAIGTVPINQALALAGITLFLTIVSWLDDLRSLGALVRFGSHCLGVSVALWISLVSGPFLNGWVSPGVETILIGVGWVWFINLFNFMDGIDGIAASETLAIGAGGSGLILVANGDPSVAAIGLVCAGAALGFLPSNWNPAKVFLGDVGSIPLGFLCAWVLLSMASQDLGMAALILSLVFLADATLTLLKRLIRREKIWQAHRQHFYQQAVQRGMSHAQATTAASIANLILVGLAYWSLSGNEFEALGGAVCIIALLFIYYLKGPISVRPDGIVS